MSWKNDQVTQKETARIISLATKALEIGGDFVEFGCYRGDTSLLLADILKNSDKTLYLYDSFEGLPAKSPEDFSVLGEDFKQGELLTPKRELKIRFLRANLSVPIIKKAWFSDLDPTNDLPEKIAFAFLDGDFYDSIKTSLNLIAPKMSKNGIVIVHDYNNPALPGVKKAVDEWQQKNPTLTFKLDFLNNL